MLLSLESVLCCGWTQRHGGKDDQARAPVHVGLVLTRSVGSEEPGGKGDEGGGA